MHNFIATKVDKMNKKARHTAVTATVLKFLVKDHIGYDGPKRNIKFQVTYADHTAEDQYRKRVPLVIGKHQLESGSFDTKHKRVKTDHIKTWRPFPKLQSSPQPQFQAPNSSIPNHHPSTTSMLSTSIPTQPRKQSSQEHQFGGSHQPQYTQRRSVQME